MSFEGQVSFKNFYCLRPWFYLPLSFLQTFCKSEDCKSVMRAVESSRLHQHGSCVYYKRHSVSCAMLTVQYWTLLLVQVWVSSSQTCRSSESSRQTGKQTTLIQDVLQWMGKQMVRQYRAILTKEEFLPRKSGKCSRRSDFFFIWTLNSIYISKCLQG